MKTAEEILNKNHWFGTCPDSMSRDDIPDLVSTMKEYAKQVAQQALNDAWGNIKYSEWSDYKYGCPVKEEDITGTQIVTP